MKRLRLLWLIPPGLIALVVLFVVSIRVLLPISLWWLLWVIPLGFLAVPAALIIFVVLLAIILMAVPIRYNIEGTTAEGNVVKARVSYLLRLIRVKFDYENGTGSPEIRVLWFKFGGEKNARKNWLSTLWHQFWKGMCIVGRWLKQLWFRVWKRNGVDSQESIQNSTHTTLTQVPAAHDNSKSEATVGTSPYSTKPSHMRSGFDPKFPMSSHNLDSQSAPAEEIPDSPKPSFRERIESIRNIFQSIRNLPTTIHDFHNNIHKKVEDVKSTINTVRTYPNRKIITRLTIDLLKRQLQLLKPKKLTLRGTVGFADPSQTATVIGACAVATEMFNLRKNINIGADLHADNFVADLNLHIKGRVNILRHTASIIRFVLRKPIRQLISDVIQKNK